MKQIDKLEDRISSLESRVNKIEWGIEDIKKDDCTHPLNKRIFEWDSFYPFYVGKRRIEKCGKCDKIIKIFESEEESNKAKADWHRKMADKLSSQPIGEQKEE